FPCSGIAGLVWQLGVTPHAFSVWLPKFDGKLAGAVFAGNRARRQVLSPSRHVAAKSPVGVDAGIVSDRPPTPGTPTTRSPPLAGDVRSRSSAVVVYFTPL